MKEFPTKDELLEIEQEAKAAIDKSLKDMPTYEELNKAIGLKPRKLRISYTCSDFKKHNHKYRWTAYICGKIQYLARWVKGKYYGDS